MTHTIQPSNPETTPAPDATDVPATRPATGVAAAATAVPAALKRRIPKYSDLAPLMQFKKPEFSRAARLSRASTIWDLRDMAKRRTPQAPFDYTDGAAEAEISLRRARQAFLDIEFRPGILRDVSSIDLSTDILGGPSRLPVGDRPHRFHPDDAVRGRIRRLARPPRPPASPTPSPPWAPRRSRTWPRPHPTAATGSSCTCGRTATARWN